MRVKMVGTDNGRREILTGINGKTLRNVTIFVTSSWKCDEFCQDAGLSRSGWESVLVFVLSGHDGHQSGMWQKSPEKEPRKELRKM